MKTIAVIIIVLFLTSCVNDYSYNPSNVDSEVGLGDYLIFPDGWDLHDFGFEGYSDDRFIFICSRKQNNEIIYRFCTPDIKKVE